MIEVGEFFRTKNGNIFKLDNYWLFNDNYKKLDIVSHSSNIIDLIQEGDYVNGELIIEIDKMDNKKIIGNETCYMEEQDIKSIVTHEQFKAIEYKVEKEKK